MGINTKIVNVRKADIINRNGGTVNEGDRIILLEREYVGPNRVKCGHFWELVPLSSHPEGIGGNMNPNSKRFNGWRGTSDDWCVTAHGVWDVMSAEEGRLNDYTCCIGPDEYDKLVRVVLCKVDDAKYVD